MSGVAHMEDQPDGKGCRIRRLAGLESKVLCKVAVSHPCPEGHIVLHTKGVKLELWSLSP